MKQLNIKNSDYPVSSVQFIWQGGNKCLLTALAHEITHAFDDEGINYDSQGSVGNLYDTHTIRAFHTEADCLRQQYSQYKLQGRRQYSQYKLYKVGDSTHNISYKVGDSTHRTSYLVGGRTNSVCAAAAGPCMQARLTQHVHCTVYNIIKLPVLPQLAVD